MSLTVITVVFNKPSFVPYQYETLKKFLPYCFEYIVFDNSQDEKTTQDFKRITEYIGCKYVRIPLNKCKGGDPSSNAGSSLDFALRNIYNSGYRGMLMVLDSDMFLIKTFDPIKTSENFDFIGISNSRGNINYYTNQLLFLNLATLPNFLDITFIPGFVNGTMCDCGGCLHDYLNKNKEVRHRGVSFKLYDNNLKSYFDNEIKIFNKTSKNVFKRDIDDEEGMNPSDGNKTFSEVFADSFLHLRAGSNWIGYDKTISFERENNLFTFLCNILIDWKIEDDKSNKHIISFSLYGNNPKYTHNAIMNAIIAERVYKGWICRYYYDHTVPEEIISILQSLNNTELIKIESGNDSPSGDKMFWRFYPSSEPDVAVFISRDCDSWLSFREACSVKKWVESDKMVHIIRDHCYHSQKIMGGMWGAKRGSIQNMKDMCKDFVVSNTYDQGFLANKIYPSILDTVMVHTGKDQRKMGGEPSFGYFPDNGTELEPYYKILEYVPGIDIEKMNSNNSFNCCHCGKVHQFFIGEMFNNISIIEMFMEPFFIREKYSGFIPVIYGPWISEGEVLVQKILLLKGKKIYSIREGGYTKMVSEDGEARYNQKVLNETNLQELWETSSPAQQNYKLKIS